MARKFTPAMHKLSALAGSIDLAQAAGTVGLTLISGMNRGEFKTPIRYLGTVCYVVTEVSPVTCQPIIRGYSAGIGNFAHEVMIGSWRFNTMAHDPTGRSRLRFPESDAVAMAVSRMLPYMADGASLVSADEVLLPELLAQLDTDVMATGVNSNKLRELGKRVRLMGQNWNGFRAPVSGYVVEVRATDNPQHVVVVIQSDVESSAGKLFEVRLPRAAKFAFAAAADADATHVKTGESLVRNINNVSDFVLEDFAWLSLRQEVTLPNGDKADVVPFAYVSEAIRQKRVEPTAIYEDVEKLLGPSIENPALIVRAGLELPEKIHEADAVLQSAAISRFRRELGDYASFATDEDLLQGLQFPADPLHLTGMASVQHWRIEDAESMLLKRPDCSVDLQGMKPAWRRLHRSPDLEPVLQKVLVETELMRESGEYADAVLKVLRRYPTLCAQTITKIEEMVDNGTAGDAEVHGYVSNLHQHVQARGDTEVHHGEPASHTV